MLTCHDSSLPQTGTPLTEDELLSTHYASVDHLQRISFAHFSPQLTPLAMAPISSIDQREKLMEYLLPLEDATVRELCAKLHLLPEESAAATSLVPQVRRDMHRHKHHMVMCACPRVMLDSHMLTRSHPFPFTALP